MNNPDFVPADPAINPESAPYWREAGNGRLLVKLCRACDKRHHYPRDHCPHCLSNDTVWTEAEGGGTIYSFSVMRRAATPYVVAFVTLDEGVTMITNIVGSAFDDIAIGARVELTFAASESGQKVPVFRLAGGN